MQSKSLTVRLPEALYQTATEVARRRSMSLNALVQESLLHSIRTEEEKARYDAYSALGEESENEEFAIHAQAEVMLRE